MNEFLKDKKFILSSALGLIFLGFSLFINYWATGYATEKQSSSVTDIVLSNIPNYNVANIFVYGIIATFIFSIFLVIIKPARIPFITKSSALFLLIRSVFISLTHIGLYPHTISTNFNIFDSITTGGDLFFSGHTGFPFLMALIFWKNKLLRYIFLFLSGFFGIIALLGHYHYSIDVLAAFFITFGIYNICIKLFKKDYEYFNR
jgi:membrane-associated phospholipid phosphatase